MTDLGTVRNTSEETQDKLLVKNTLPVVPPKRSQDADKLQFLGVRGHSYPGNAGQVMALV